MTDADDDRIRAEAEQAVLDAGTTPADGLIVLHHAGRQLLPSWQYGLDGVPIPIVVEISAHLDAGIDPWGVASWWISPHPRLKGLRPLDSYTSRTSTTRFAGSRGSLTWDSSV